MMKSVFTILFLLFSILKAHSQCVNTTAYGNATINSCSSATISTCNWASEYSELMFNTTGTYTFASSTSTDWLTLTTAANVVIAFGQQPLVATIPSLGAYRLHVTTNSSCATENVCRITSYACGAVSTTTGCIQPSSFGSASINSYGSSQITSCNYAGEYSELTIGVSGLFTFASSNPSDYLTLTDASNVILFSGTTPLNTNITSLGAYRLHVSTSSACGTDNSCRITSYTCAPNTPCSGTPNAGTTSASSYTVCGAQNINFNLIGSTIATGLSYQWQSSVNNTTWANIGGQINATMMQLVSSNMYYRCVVACGTNTASSVSQLITVGGNPTGGTTLASATSICSGGSINFSLFGNSNWVGLSYQWQVSTNNTTWSNLLGYTTPVISYAPSSAIYVRCLLSCGSSTATSTSVYMSAPVAITHAILPLYETFDNTWQNGCATRNIPDATHWSSSPLTGDNAWRRQNDGASASWNNATTGIAIPQSGTGCANFHSTQVEANIKGDLEVYVNMNQIGKYAISFYYTNPTGNDNLTVLLSDNAGISYSIKGYYQTQNSWNKKTIYYTTTQPSPSTIVRFRGEGTANTIDDLAIDSLAIRFICASPIISASASNSLICSGQTTTLTAIGASSYTWIPSSITGSVAVVSPISNTVYILTASNDGLCFSTSVISVSVSNCAIGIEEFEAEKNILVYPNPAKDVIEIDFLTHVADGIVLTDVLGKVVLKENKLKQRNELLIGHLQAGLYFYQLHKNNKTVGQGKIIKE